MPYQFLDDIATADIAFRAWGPDLAELFTGAAEATVNIMSDAPQNIRPQVSREVSLRDKNLDILLFKFLQEIVFYKDSEQLLLRPRKVTVVPGFSLTADLVGEKLDAKRHVLKVDIKAITLHRLQVVRIEKGWECVVVADI